MARAAAGADEARAAQDTLSQGVVGPSGFAYKDIQEICGGKTYTWVNCHITEGRAALRRAQQAAELG